MALWPKSGEADLGQKLENLTGARLSKRSENGAKFEISVLPVNGLEQVGSRLD